MIKKLLVQFRPTILFLAKFIGLYFLLNIGYGAFVNSFNPKPDPATVWVTNQTSGILDFIGWETEIINHSEKPTTSIIYKGKGIVSVYEGCNGINVIIIFLCFLVSFGPISKKLLWFVPTGLLAIHFFNLVRILVLFMVAIYLQDYVYFAHKYFFTAIIYAVVFALWLVWIRINYLKPS